MKRILLYILVVLMFHGCSFRKNPAFRGDAEIPVYQENWESLAQHDEAPEWFRDAKLGIYFHWGVYSVPAFGNEWYPRWMHFEGTDEYKHHQEQYGTPAEFGYHDFVPMFTAEHFDAEEWADLFLRAGARFAGPVAEHHDGFSMWDSEITPWNTVDRGPKKDITGLLREAFDSRGIKLITTFHHGRNLQRYRQTATEEAGKENMWEMFSNSHYPWFDGMPPTSDDPELKYLYGNIPEEEWLQEVWFGKLKEVIDKYHPDIMWFDSWLDRIPESYRLKYCAYYLNQAEMWGKEVVIVRKQDDLPLECTVDDLEKSRKNQLDERVWMTDETVSTGSWCFTRDLQIKETRDILHVLIDIVSKNGVLLLNISPRADGTIPDDQQEVLLGMGAWLERFGEAIYGTRPWITYGEGPTKEPEGHFSNADQFLKIKYSAKDIRYTTRENVVYAIILGWPGDGEEVLLQSFSEQYQQKKPEITGVDLVGSDAPMIWNLSPRGLRFTLPVSAPDSMAVVLKISLGT